MGDGAKLSSTERELDAFQVRPVMWMSVPFAEEPVEDDNDVTDKTLSYFFSVHIARTCFNFHQLTVKYVTQQYTHLQYCE